MLDERPDPETIWTVAAFCQVCRLHLHVKVDYTIRFEEAPCPSTDHPLHHLVRSEFQEPLERNAWLRQNPKSRDEIFTYKCSSKTCSATVTVRLSPPVLRPSDLQHLLDPEMLRQRTEDAFKERDGNTEGMRHPEPIDVLTDLRAYVRNSWRAHKDAKFGSINLSNRRFVVRFGPEGTACKDVLERLGFQLVVRGSMLFFVTFTHTDVHSLVNVGKYLNRISTTLNLFKVPLTSGWTMLNTSSEACSYHSRMKSASSCTTFHHPYQLKESYLALLAVKIVSLLRLDILGMLADHRR